MSLKDDLKAGFGAAVEKTKSVAGNVAENVSERGSKYVDFSRKEVEYSDVKKKLQKSYEKYGEMMYKKAAGEEVSEDDISVAESEIKAYLERMAALEPELNETRKEVKEETTQLGHDISNTAKNVASTIKKQAEGIAQGAKDVFGTEGTEAGTETGAEESTESTETDGE